MGADFLNPNLITGTLGLKMGPRANYPASGLLLLAGLPSRHPPTANT